MKSITLCFFLLFLTLSLIGQECGTHVHEHDRERISRDFAQFHQNIGNYMPSFSRSNPTTPDIIVIKPHLVNAAVSSWAYQVQGLSYTTILNSLLAHVNTTIGVNTNTLFVLDPIDHIYSLSLSNISISERGDFASYASQYPNHINVFFTESIDDIGGYSSQVPPVIYLYGEPFIALEYGTTLSGNQTALTHELGHFFGLIHTFENVLGYERINGSNCLTAGDLICDTPADNYTDAIKTQINISTCTYTGTERECADNLGLQYNPPVNNIMTYWSTYTCNNIFTPQQYTRMNYTKEKYLGYLYKGNDVWATIEPVSYSCNVNNDVSFATKSHNVASYLWSFPGGIPSTSTSAVPFVSYPNAGNYDVTLTVTGTNGSSYTTTETNYVDIKERNSISNANVSALDFENNTLGNWITESNEDNACGSWQIIPISGTYGNALRLSTIAIKEGRRYDFKSPFIQFQNYAQLQLSFDYAYSPSIGASGVRYDILQVVFLSACGQESILAQKTGTDLSTVANGSNIQFYPNSSEWAGENIDLLSSPNFPISEDWGQIIIRVYSFNGNSLYLDNIKLQGQVPNIAFGLEANYNSMFHYADLVWVDNSQVESGYVVERQDDLGNFYTIATLPPNTTTYSDIALLPSTTHYYRVRAIINGSPFTPSDSTSIHTFPLPLPPVLTISGSGSQANLSFTIPGQAIGSETQIYYTAGGGGLSQIASLPIVSIGYAHTGLASNMIHSYAAKHKQGYFSSVFSNQVSYSTATAASDPIIAIEYFIDNEPGIGNGITVSVATGVDISHTFSPVISGLSEGFHVLGVRVKTSASKWSETVHSVFFKTTGGSSTLNDGIVEIEYFINTDPGTGNATTITVTPSVEEEYAISMNLNGVPNGINVCGIRTKDVFGNWSAAAYSTFFKTDGFAANEVRIEQFEYFVDNEPGVGNGTLINVSPNVDGTYVLNINLNGLTNGLHSLGMRSKDELGNWSATTYSTFFKGVGLAGSEIRIEQFEYFVDNEPGVGNGTPINVSPSVDGTYILNIDLNGISNGLHSLGMRSKDELGTWSATAYSIFMKVNDNTTPEHLVHSEYFVDTDLGIGNGISIGTPLVTDGTWTFNINTSNLSWGNHTIYVRVKDNFERWSITATDEICYEYGLPAYSYNNDNGLVVDFQTYNIAKKYEWNFGNGQTSTLQNPTITYAVAGTYNVCLTMFTDCDTIAVCQTITVSDAPLPVDLLYFTGEVTESGNLLNWATASENNNKGFNVQRSLNDGKDWQTLGFVDGNGTTSEIHQYEYLDENPALGLNYYRLEQVDFDGTISYSNIVVLKNEETTGQLKISLYPNPTTINSNVTLKIEGEAIGTITCEIIGASGQVLKTVTIEHNTNQSTHQIETPAISGIYFLRLSNNERVLESVQFIVN